MRITDTESGDSENGLGGMQVGLVVFGLVAPVLTFILAVSGVPDNLKIFILVVLALGYSAICFWAFRSARGRTLGLGKAPSPIDDVDRTFDAIDEASEFFGSSLKPADLFRLLSSRLPQIVPVSGCALFAEAESESGTLEVIEATGPNVEHLLGTKVAAGDGLAGMSWVSREVELDTGLALESKSMPAEALAEMTSAAAIPLIHDDKVFAVLVLYSAAKIDDDPGFRSTLQAIGDRVSPLFVSSISLDRSASNALIDTVTQLPNERAFYLVLENQLAESLRFRDERPLTVLSVDIKDFAEVNQTFGYSAGDLILGFVAKVLSLHLRKMDFLARSTNDEFLIILPTASERLAAEIVQRIRQRFASEPFSITETDEIKVWLNVGWATFWQDGETAEQLLQNARLRKQQAKAEEPANVIWFPKEYVN